MSEIADAELEELVDSAFRAGQERMRNRAAVRAGTFIPLQDPELLRLGGEVANKILDLNIYGVREAEERADMTDEQIMADILSRRETKQ